MNEDWQNLDITVANMLHLITEGWNKFHAYIDTLSDEQLTRPTDAAGWTVKDHIIHLAMWENGINAMLDKQSRLAGMGVPQVTWESGFDEINAVIQKKNQTMPLEQVRNTFEDVHQRLMTKLQSLDDEDLMRPYNYYQSDSEDESAVFGRIVGNTFAHYEEHLPWIQAIVDGA